MIGLEVVVIGVAGFCGQGWTAAGSASEGTRAGLELGGGRFGEEAGRQWVRRDGGGLGGGKFVGFPRRKSGVQVLYPRSGFQVARLETAREI